LCLDDQRVVAARDERRRAQRLVLLGSVDRLVASIRRVAGAIRGERDAATQRAAGIVARRAAIVARGAAVGDARRARRARCEEDARDRESHAETFARSAPESNPAVTVASLTQWAHGPGALLRRAVRQVLGDLDDLSHCVGLAPHVSDPLALIQRHAIRIEIEEALGTIHEPRRGVPLYGMQQIWHAPAEAGRRSAARM